MIPKDLDFELEDALESLARADTQQEFLAALDSIRAVVEKMTRSIHAN